MLAALIVSLAMSVSAQNFFLGLQGQSCAATCGAVGRTCLTNIPLDMPSTQVSCRGAFRSKNWLDGIPSVGGLAGWKREGKILVCVDNGNS